MPGEEAAKPELELGIRGRVGDQKHLSSRFFSSPERHLSVHALQVIDCVRAAMEK